MIKKHVLYFLFFSCVSIMGAQETFDAQGLDYSLLEQVVHAIENKMPDIESMMDKININVPAPSPIHAKEKPLHQLSVLPKKLFFDFYKTDGIHSVLLLFSLYAIKKLYDAFIEHTVKNVAKDIVSHYDACIASCEQAITSCDELDNDYDKQSFVQKIAYRNNTKKRKIIANLEKDFWQHTPFVWRNLTSLIVPLGAYTGSSLFYDKISMDYAHALCTQQSRDSYIVSPGNCVRAISNPHASCALSPSLYALTILMTAYLIIRSCYKAWYNYLKHNSREFYTYLQEEVEACSDDDERCEKVVSYLKDHVFTSSKGAAVKHIIHFAFASFVMLIGVKCSAFYLGNPQLCHLYLKEGIFQLTSWARKGFLRRSY